MKNSFFHWIATLGPIGHSKIAPGSLGSLAALVLVLLIGHNPPLFLFSSCVLVLIAVWASTVTAADLGEKDPASVVIDEVCGVMVSFLFLPITWRTLILGFLGFRFFDIVKPPPIRQMEFLPKGFGIVLDDVVAGIYTNLILQLLVRYAHL